MSANDDTILARLKTQNVHGFVSDMGAAAKSVLGLATANEEAAVSARLSWIEHRAMQQALYTTRRYTFWTTTALGALAGASVKAGLTFAENRRQGIDAFTATLGSVTAARREMNLLTADTHLTGLQLGELTSNAETMQSFGFTIKDVNEDILTLANYAERAGKGVSGFESLVQVFDRIQQNGRLTSLDLRTLTSEGIPAIQILQHQLNLTASQVAALQQGKLIIPAQYALPALARGLQQRSNILGTSVEQQIGITRGFLAQIFGTGETGLFGFITKGLAHINTILGRAAKGQQQGGTEGLLLGLDPSGRILRAWNLFAGVARSVGDALHFAWTVSAPLRFLFSSLAGVTVILAGNTGFLSLALKTLVFWWIASRTAMLSFAVGSKIVAASETAYITALYAYDLALAIFTGDTAAATAALTALNLAFLANPITLVVIGVAALGAGMYLLVTRVHAVRDAFTASFLAVKRAVADAYNFIADAWNRLSFHIGGFSLFGHHFGGFNVGVTPIPLLPFLATGGNVYPGGGAIVGDRGPELLSNIGGVSRVTPLTHPGGPAGSGIEAVLDRVADRIVEALNGASVKMDGQKVGELVTSKKQLRAALA